MPRKQAPNLYSPSQEPRPVTFMPILVDEPTAAAMLGVSPRTVFSLVETGHLPTKTIPGATSKKLFLVDDLRTCAATFPAYTKPNRKDHRKEQKQ